MLDYFIILIEKGKYNMVITTFFLIIFLLFPFLIYFIYLVYSDLKSDKEKDYILDIVLLTSFYLTTIQNKITASTITLINIPLVISIMKKRKFTSFVLILLILNIYKFIIPEINTSLLFLEYLLIYILINIVKKYEVSIFLSIKLVFSIIMNLIIKSNFIEFNLLDIVFLYLIFLFFQYIYIKFESIVFLRLALVKTVKEQKRFQDLFKIAHEVKNPLSVCKGYLQMLDIKDKEKSQKYIDIINIQIDKTLQILKDFSNISNLKIEKKEINLNLLLDEISHEISLFNTIDVSIETNIPLEKIMVEGDFNRLKQVLLKVVKNSNEAIVNKGKIKIDLYKKQKYAVIKVKDNGSGMDYETLNNLYKPFFTTKKNGTGLGVCLSKEIIEKHNGKIEYNSKLNKGTTVTIKLPLKKASI